MRTGAFGMVLCASGNLEWRGILEAGGLVLTDRLGRGCEE